MGEAYSSCGFSFLHFYLKGETKSKTFLWEAGVHTAKTKVHRPQCKRVKVNARRHVLITCERKWNKRIPFIDII
jgi:hypothetical protein